jgi:putative oxidoreductase
MAYEKLAQYGPLPIRVLAGIAFIIHGLPKLSNIAGTEHFFANMVGLPAALALPVGLLEVIGGIALVVGILTRIAPLSLK